jgi:hypothetical protein
MGEWENGRMGEWVNGGSELISPRIPPLKGAER